MGVGEVGNKLENFTILSPVESLLTSILGHVGFERIIAPSLHMLVGLGPEIPRI